MMTTDQKGAIAETAIAAGAVRLGVDVYRPIAEGVRYDLILEVDSRLYRVQRKRGAALLSCRRGPNGYIRRMYTAEEIDAVAAYFVRFAGSPAARVRLAPARNKSATQDQLG